MCAQAEAPRWAAATAEPPDPGSVLTWQWPTLALRPGKPEGPQHHPRCIYGNPEARRASEQLKSTGSDSEGDGHRRKAVAVKIGEPGSQKDLGLRVPIPSIHSFIHACIHSSLHCSLDIHFRVPLLRCVLLGNAFRRLN